MTLMTTGVTVTSSFPGVKCAAKTELREAQDCLPTRTRQPASLLFSWFTEYCLIPESQFLLFEATGYNLYSEILSNCITWLKNGIHALDFSF